MMSAETLIKQQRVVRDSTTQRIIALLEWAPQDLYLFQYECGLEFLRAYFGSDEKAAAIIEARKEFWNWWKMLWSNRDQVFAEEHDVSPLPYDVRIRLYRELHNPRTLACDRSLPSIVYPDDFTIIKSQL
jgi:hypothetical protein